MHPRERHAHVAPPVLNSCPKVDLQFCIFFITEEEFELRINAVCFQSCKIGAFAKFVKDNHRKIKEKHLVYGDLPKVTFQLRNLSILRAYFERYVVRIRLNFWLSLIFADSKLKKMSSKILMCPCYKEEFVALLLLVLIVLNILFILSASVDEHICHTCFSARITHLEKYLSLQEVGT